jgi:hypothetical protein
LLPLQEARRQRRMIAAEGAVRLGTGSLPLDVGAWGDKIRAGCVVLTTPHGVAAARWLLEQARRQKRCVEVLLADGGAEDQKWEVRSYQGPGVRCELPGPGPGLIDRWVEAEEPLGVRLPGSGVSTGETQAGLLDAVGWFLRACEALGDAALAKVHQPIGDVERVQALEQCLLVVTDHEILHQELGRAVKAMIQWGQ